MMTTTTLMTIMMRGSQKRGKGTIEVDRTTARVTMTGEPLGRVDKLQVEEMIIVRVLVVAGTAITLPNHDLRGGAEGRRREEIGGVAWTSQIILMTRGEMPPLIFLPVVLVEDVGGKTVNFEIQRRQEFGKST